MMKVVMFRSDFVLRRKESKGSCFEGVCIGVYRFCVENREE